MTAELLFLIALLVVVAWLNRDTIARVLGRPVKPCAWSRIHARDREGRKAWFCPSCGREELVEGSDPPPDCGAVIPPRQRKH